jgi:predicted nucleotide-binding protein
VGALQDQLNAKANVTTWNQGVFALNASYVDSLIDGWKNSDFGVFVFSPDDILTMRKERLRKGGRRGFQG